MYCRECNYDLRGKDHGECPECGTVYDIDLSETYFNSPTPSFGKRIAIRILSDLLGISVFLFSIWLLLQVQCKMVDLWLDTHTSGLFGPKQLNHGAWWVPVGPGKWMLPLQISLLFLIAALFGLIVRRMIRRRFLPEFH